MKKPSDFTQNIPNSLFQSNFKEDMFMHIMHILTRTGNEWRSLSWEEYKKEKEKEIELFINHAEKIFYKVRPFTLSADLAEQVKEGVEWLKKRYRDEIKTIYFLRRKNTKYHGYLLKGLEKTPSVLEHIKNYSTNSENEYPCTVNEFEIIEFPLLRFNPLWQKEVYVDFTPTETDYFIDENKIYELPSNCKIYTKVSMRDLFDLQEDGFISKSFIGAVHYYVDRTLPQN